MTLRKLVGWVLLVSPFVFVLGVEVIDKGWLYTLGTLLFVLGVMALIASGVRLIGR
jgi:hypothetical protein